MPDGRLRRAADTACSATSLAALGSVRNAGLLLGAVLWNAAQLLVVVYDCDSETDVFHYDAFWTWVLNPVGASVGEELSAKNNYNYPWALCIFAVLLALRHGVERCFAGWFS